MEYELIKEIEFKKGLNVNNLIDTLIKLKRDGLITGEEEIISEYDCQEIGFFNIKVIEDNTYDEKEIKIKI